MEKILSFCFLFLNLNLILSESSTYNYSNYSAQSKNTNLTNANISCESDGESAIYITSEGIVIKNSTIFKSGNFSGDIEDSEFYGINAAILVQGGELTMIGGNITTNAKGSNSLVATNEGRVIISDTNIISTGASSARGLHATYGGIITASNVNISSSGGSCATLATDRGEGTVTCSGCILSTEGSGSPLIYSTGEINISNTIGTALAAQAVVVEGKNSVNISSSSNLKCSANGNGRNDSCGILIYQSQSGDADTGTSTFICESSSLEILSLSDVYNSTPFFYVTNTEANIYLTNCTFAYGSNIFLLADEGDLGSISSNGGSVTMILTNQNIEGDFIFGSSSSLTLTLINSSLKGTINTNKTAAKIEIVIDENSSITLTGNSYYTSLTNKASNGSNIIIYNYTWENYNKTSSSNSDTDLTNSSSVPHNSSSNPPDKPEGSDDLNPPENKNESDFNESDFNIIKDNTLLNITDAYITDLNATDTNIIENSITNINIINTKDTDNNTDAIISDSFNNDSNITHENIIETNIANTNNINYTNITYNNIVDTTSTFNQISNEIDTTFQIIITNSIDNINVVSVILLGYSHFEINETEKYFSFFIYFVPILNSIYSKNLTFPITVLYNTVLRHLKDYQSVCTLQGSNSETKLNYKCEVITESDNIRQIQIEPKFTFSEQKVILLGITSLANSYMSRIQEVKDQFNYLENSNVFILEHSIYAKYNSNLFNISGIMSGQPSFDNTDLVLNINTDSNTEKNINCSIYSIENNNYTLICESNEDIDTNNLQSAY